MNLRRIRAWFNGWCPRETLIPRYIRLSENKRRMHRIGWLAFNGVGLALLTVSLLVAPTFASGGETVVRMETVEQDWRSSQDSAVTYRAGLFSKFLTMYKVKINFRCELDMEGGRTTKLVYKVYSNGVHIGDIDDTYQVSSLKGGGDYGLITIPIETLMIGENTVHILIDCNSATTAPMTGPDTFEFIIDSAVVTDNIRLTFLVILLLVPANLFKDGVRSIGAT
jgi:hypothetical protein